MKFWNVLTFIFFLSPSLLLFSQAPTFHGAPLAVEELSYELDASGNRNPTPQWAVIYHFDEKGRLAEHWWKTNPGAPDAGKWSQSHTVHTWREDGRIWKSTEYDENEKVQDVYEHEYDANGKLVRVKWDKSFKQFSQDMEVLTDSLDRIVYNLTHYPHSSEPPVITETVFTGDTLAVSTSRDESGKVLMVYTRRFNPQGDPLEVKQTEGDGTVKFHARNTYQYDDAGNWVERRSQTTSVLFDETRHYQTADTRRIIYPYEYPETLTQEYLPGSWASFLHGLQLDFFADGTYLAYTWGSRKDGGQWTLDTKKNILSVTGKEHRDTAVPLDFRYEKGAIVLYKPGEEGEARLLKIK